MNHGSKYLWVYQNEEEAEEEMEVDSEIKSNNVWDHYDETTPRISDRRTSSSSPSPAKKKKVKFRTANTNVVSIDFSTLENGVQISTGDPMFCTSCKAIFNQDSKLIIGEEKDPQIWVCEFCSHKNQVNIHPEEIPKSDSVDYIIAPATNVSQILEDSGLIIFCIDISGSMCVSYELKGKVQLKGGADLNKFSSFTETNAFGGFADQWLPNENRNITYATRLQCVQAAIASQIETLYKENPNTKVGIITFNSEVTLLGDGTQQQVSIVGDKLNQYESIMDIAKEFQITTCVKDAKAALTKKLFELEEGGPTALGPAVVASLGICRNKVGSKIVICTDGLSNIGLGSLDVHTDQERDNVSQFYEKIGNIAKEEGILISVISIKGEECSLENLGTLADLTHGTVDRVDPLTIAKDFQSILTLPVIATHVSLEILLHKGLFIIDSEKDDDEQEKKSYAVKDIGNVTKESSITLEYGIRVNYVEEFKNLKALPFQIKIHFTKLDGMKCLRVITKSQEITFSKEEAEKHAEVPILASHAVQQSAKLGMKGDYLKARLTNLSSKVMLSRTSKSPAQRQQFTSWSHQARDLESELSSAQKKEMDEGFNEDEDDDSSEDIEKSIEKKEKVKKSRRNKRNDATSNMFYNMKSANSKKFM